jgi:SAM-dependent methyltransferase
MNHQFGGRLFIDSGRLDIAAMIREDVLSSRTDVLDIGCGVGRLATALTGVLNTGKYFGLDVDQTSIRSCQGNPLFRGREFYFDHIDFYTTVYNPSGGIDSTSGVLPMDDKSVDLIVAMSVFTHMFSKECENYAAEMLRIIRPHGAILVTAFVLDQDGSDLGFPHKSEDGSFRNAAKTRKAVAHNPQDFSRWFGNDVSILRGQWHSRGVAQAPRGQDWVLVRR